MIDEEVCVDGDHCVGFLLALLAEDGSLLVATSTHQTPYCRELQGAPTMADFALGLTKMAVEGTVRRRVKPVAHRITHRRKVHIQRRQPPIPTCRDREEEVPQV